VIITYKELDKIVFPIFKLPSDSWVYEDGLVLLGDKVIDDRKSPGKTLGIRRIQSGRDNLLPLNKPVFDIASMLSNTSVISYVSNTGKCFTYKKTAFTKLKSFLIKKVERKGPKSIIWLKGISYPFAVDRPPDESMSYANILFLYTMPWLIYNFSVGPIKDSYKKV
jgi:hypothetical protein